MLPPGWYWWWQWRWWWCCALGYLLFCVFGTNDGSSGSVDKPVGYGMQHLQGLASWLPPQAGMFMWMKLEGGVKDADDIIDALKDEQVAVVPGVRLLRVAST